MNIDEFVKVIKAERKELGSVKITLDCKEVIEKAKEKGIEIDIDEKMEFKAESFYLAGFLSEKREDGSNTFNVGNVNMLDLLIVREMIEERIESNTNELAKHLLKDVSRDGLDRYIESMVEAIKDNVKKN